MYVSCKPNKKVPVEKTTSYDELQLTHNVGSFSH